MLGLRTRNAQRAREEETLSSQCRCLLRGRLLLSVGFLHAVRPQALCAEARDHLLVGRRHKEVVHGFCHDGFALSDGRQNIGDFVIGSVRQSVQSPETGGQKISLPAVKSRNIQIPDTLCGRKAKGEETFYSVPVGGIAEIRAHGSGQTARGLRYIKGIGNFPQGSIRQGAEIAEMPGQNTGRLQPHVGIPKELMSL